VPAVELTGELTLPPAVLCSLPPIRSIWPADSDPPARLIVPLDQARSVPLTLAQPPVLMISEPVPPAAIAFPPTYTAPVAFHAAPELIETCPAEPLSSAMIPSRLCSVPLLSVSTGLLPE